jgi:hypothetical protein
MLILARLWPENHKSFPHYIFNVCREFLTNFYGLSDYYQIPCKLADGYINIRFENPKCQ